MFKRRRTNPNQQEEGVTSARSETTSDNVSEPKVVRINPSDIRGIVVKMMTENSELAEMLWESGLAKQLMEECNPKLAPLVDHITPLQSEYATDEDAMIDLVKDLKVRYENCSWVLQNGLVSGTRPGEGQIQMEFHEPPQFWLITFYDSHGGERQHVEGPAKDITLEPIVSEEALERSTVAPAGEIELNPTGLPPIGPEVLPTDFEAVGDEPGVGGDLFAQAVQAWNRGDMDRAAALYEDALRQGLTPTYACGALAQLGQIHLRRGDLERGVDCLLRCLATRPIVDGPAHDAAVRLQIIYEEASRPDEARALSAVAQTTVRPGVTLAFSAAEDLRKLVRAAGSRGATDADG